MKRALISVSDKTGVTAFAAGLVAAGFEVISTGGTLRTLLEAGVPAVSVESVTGFAEILDGRVKTLHPAVHAGLLARDEEAHLAQLDQAGIRPIDLVAVNLYPFRETTARPGVSFDEAVEQIDIGGPTMIRAAAKNSGRVLVVVDPADYDVVLTAVRDGTEAALRPTLARKAFAHTAAYDAAITAYLDRAAGDAETGSALLPDTLHLTLERVEVLRYGENPHQQAATYREQGKSGWWERLIQHKGSALSYLNVFDAEAAWRLAHEFSEPACVIVKHANPCGVALGVNALDAYARAFACDPRSAFGGVVAINRPVNGDVATQIMANAKADVLIAPAFDEAALDILGSARRTMRVLEAPAPAADELEVRRIDGGFLVQERDRVLPREADWQVVTKVHPTEDQWLDLETAWTICAYTGSNAIVLVKDRQAVGIGAGQQSRVDAAEIAAQKAAGRAEGGACASDAFYPFRDGLDAAAAAGVAAVIQPGGSVRDDEVIAAADEHGVAMVFTGRRHFRH
jgi:phosphoribosylaminoimidazolecarboxamide formyltransferase/IMP cyclohydrolase